MTPTPLDTLLQQFGITTSDLTGATVSGEIPLSNAVVNRFVAAQLARHDAPVASVQIDAQNDDAVLARVVAKARFVPAIQIAAHIERQPQLPGDPVLWLRWSLPGMGALALFAAPALSLFKVLPPGVRAEGDRIGIDLRELLVARGLGELLEHLRDLRVNTRPGGFVLRFDVRVAGPSGG